MQLLLVGDPADLTAVYVGYKAEGRGMRVHALDEGRFGIDWRLAFDDSATDSDCILTGEARVLLRQVGGAYVRFHHAPALSDDVALDPEETRLYLGQRRNAIHALLSRLPCGVANPPGAGHSNGSKPYQMTLLAQDRLSPPEWIATNDPAEARRFAALWPDGTVVKSCSGLRSEVRLLDDDLLQRLGSGSPPVIVQRRIRGRNVRLHTVGMRAFATHVDGTDAIDYRFDAQAGRYTAGPAPREIVARCIRFARAQGLLIAGFDFRLGEDGTWWCLECNPAPTFLPYELAAGQPIADALLDALEASAAARAG